MTAERTWEITNRDGTKQTVTLAQYRAIIDERKVAAAPLMDAVRRGDLAGFAAAQKAFRKQIA